jgi:hypothetical protein
MEIWVACGNQAYTYANNIDSRRPPVNAEKPGALLLEERPFIRETNRDPSLAGVHDRMYRKRSCVNILGRWRLGQRR